MTRHAAPCRRSCYPPLSRGFTRFELVVSIALICVLAAVLLERVLYTIELAEKAAMERTISVLRTSLHLQAASLIAQGREEELRQFVDRNPMDWLAEKPENYAGEVSELPIGNVAERRWFYDKKSKNLIYVVHNDRHFRTGNNGSKQVVFRVRLILGKPQETRSGKSPIEGVVLERESTYSWFG